MTENNTSFEEIGLQPALIKGLNKAGITKPTAIQQAAIPKILEDLDVIGQSVTGSGKTLAYLLPLFQKIDPTKKEVQTLILAPTHELVMQIEREIKALAKNSEIPIVSAAIIGEVNIKRQIEKLKEKPQLIVGSAGRVLELIKMKKIKAHTVKTIVIDEADRLLDEHNIKTVEAVIKTTLRDRQLLLFSATINNKATKKAQEIMKEPEFIKITEKSQVNTNIEHLYIFCEEREKIDVLRGVVHALHPKKAIVFLNKNDKIQLLTAKLQFHKIKAKSIYGNASKEDRQKAIQEFKTGKIQLLISSDLAARGLDVKDITHIFNLDLPEKPENYLHRVGRTGRVDKKGIAISLVTAREMPLLKKYEQKFKIEIKQAKYFKGQIKYTK